MVHDTWLRSKKRFMLLYFENSDTQLFQPTHFVDITDIEPRKKAACFSHTRYRDRTDLNLWSKVEVTLRSRGLQAGCQCAEAFIAHSWNRSDNWGLGLGEAVR